jgi:Flp pilus assembly protein TadD
VNYDLSNEAYARALELVARVDRSDAARAAALMLTAEIEMKAAFWQDRPVDRARQVELLTRALELAPDWPDLHARLAYALVQVGRRDEARPHAGAALAGMCDDPLAADPFDQLITGVAFVRDVVASDMEELLG